ncbi:MAG: phosphate ABC transporter permease PstA [Acidimicrobiales bacterium]
MSMLTDDRRTHDPAPQRPPLTHGQLGRRRELEIALVAVGIGVGATLATGTNAVMGVLVAVVTHTALLYGASRSVEGRRKATDRLAASLVTTAFAAILVPLVSVLWTTVERGAARFDSEFFTGTMRSVVGEGGGGWHAIVGTGIVTGIAAVISVPIGVLVAVYLVEYGRGRLARSITMMVDVMTGIPSIVAGLFAYALFVLFQGPGARSGLAGGVALAVLMTPVVVRASEEMLRLVPNELREASYALGVPKWRTITKVVLPTAVAGILTGVTLAVARVIGETAPLLLVAGLAQDTNLDPFEGRMTTLPVMAYYGYAAPGFPPEPGYDRGWTAALVLVLIVVFLFTTARVLAKILQPKGLR